MWALDESGVFSGGRTDLQGSRLTLATVQRALSQGIAKTGRRARRLLQRPKTAVSGGMVRTVEYWSGKRSKHICTVKAKLY